MSRRSCFAWKWVHFSIFKCTQVSILSDCKHVLLCHDVSKIVFFSSFGICSALPVVRIGMIQLNVNGSVNGSRNVTTIAKRPTGLQQIQRFVLVVSKWNIILWHVLYLISLFLLIKSSDIIVMMMMMMISTGYSSFSGHTFP